MLQDASRRPEPASQLARSAGLIVLYYDADFERVGAVGGGEQEWFVPTDSL